MLIAIQDFRPPMPPGVLWYDARKALNAGGAVHACPTDEEPMKAPLALAAVSLGLAGFGFGGCRSEKTVRQVEPRLVEGAKHVWCQGGPPSYPGAIPDAVCAGRERPRRQEKPANSGSVLRGGAQEASRGMDEAANLGDLLSEGDVRRISGAIRGLEGRSAAAPATLMPGAIWRPPISSVLRKPTTRGISCAPMAPPTGRCAKTA